MHDMSSHIIRAVSEVFPNVPDYICHYHFLRDLGKDLMKFEYGNIKRELKRYKVTTVLRQLVRALDVYIKKDDELNRCLVNYLASDALDKPKTEILPAVLIYVLVMWVLEGETQSHGYGFPFDRPHLNFYLRLKEVYPMLRRLRNQMPKGSPTICLNKIKWTLQEKSLASSVNSIEEKVTVFDELRIAMRIAAPGGKNGLNDEGDDDIKTIEEKVNKIMEDDLELTELERECVDAFIKNQEPF